eukprot:Sdes_comp20212_c0_seq1m13561
MNSSFSNCFSAFLSNKSFASYSSHRARSAFFTLEEISSRKPVKFCLFFSQQFHFSSLVFLLFAFSFLCLGMERHVSFGSSWYDSCADSLEVQLEQLRFRRQALERREQIELNRCRNITANHRLSQPASREKTDFDQIKRKAMERNEHFLDQFNHLFHRLNLATYRGHSLPGDTKIAKLKRDYYAYIEKTYPQWH